MILDSTKRVLAAIERGYTISSFTHNGIVLAKGAQRRIVRVHGTKLAPKLAALPVERSELANSVDAVFWDLASPRGSLSETKAIQNDLQAHVTEYAKIVALYEEFREHPDYLTWYQRRLAHGMSNVETPEFLGARIREQKLLELPKEFCDIFLRKDPR